MLFILCPHPQSYLFRFIFIKLIFRFSWQIITFINQYTNYYFCIFVTFGFVSFSFESVKYDFGGIVFFFVTLPFQFSTERRHSYNVFSGLLFFVVDNVFSLELFSNPSFRLALEYLLFDTLKLWYFGLSFMTIRLNRINTPPSTILNYFLRQSQ